MEHTWDDSSLYVELSDIILEFDRKNVVKVTLNNDIVFKVSLSIAMPYTMPVYIPDFIPHLL